MKKTITLFLILCLSLAVQAQVSKTVNVTTAGTLSTLLTATEKTTITNLTLTGSIDARDFRILRDSMTVLAVLDMNAVTINAYTGTAGTKGSSSTIYPANEIPTLAFFRCSGLTNITIPSSVTSIGTSAFDSCSSLTSVTIPSSVSSIGSSAFGGCSKLTTVTIPSSVTSIGSSAFNFCSKLTAITVESGNPNYSSLDGVLFNKNQTTLMQYTIGKTGSSYSIPSSVSSIGSGAFEGCSKLTTVTIPSSVTSIGYNVFVSCSALTAIIVESGNPNYSSLGDVLFNKNQTTLIQYPIGKTSRSYLIPSSVTSIGSYAFYGCSGLTTVTIPSSVTSIGEYAFFNCNGLFNVTIPSSVTTIGSSAFWYCSGLSIVTIPSSVTSIGSYAFEGCSGLTSIYSLSPTPVYLSAANYVFDNVNKTTCTLYVPVGSKSKYEAAVGWKDFINIVENTTVFQLGINNLNIDIDSISSPVYIVTNISWSASSNQSWLTITPSTGTGDNLLILHAQANQTTTPRTAIVTVSASGVPSKTITVVQAGPKAVQLTAGGLFSSLTANELFTITNLKLIGTIDARDFKTMRDNMPQLVYLDLSSVDIAAYTGNGGTASTSITIYPANTIPDYAFCNPSNNSYIGKTTLRSVFLPLSTIYIGTSAFDSCSGLISISIPNSVTSIGGYAFYSCIGLSSLIISSSVSSVLYYAFSGCSGLSKMTIPASVTSIGNGTFSNCMKLATINVESGNLNYSTIDGVLFDKNKTTLVQYPSGKIGNSYSIPSSVTSIGNSAFDGCSSLTSVSILSSVASIGGYAFYVCSGLTSIYSLSPTPVSLSASSSVFYNVDKNTCILYVPIGSKALYQAATGWKDFTNIVEFDPTSIKNVSVQVLGIYPSAFSEGFQIKGIADVALLTIYDLKGRLLLTKAITSNEYVSASGLPKGTYIAKVRVGKNTTNHKIVKL